MTTPQGTTPPVGGLEGLRALVTGGGSGIGLGTARRLVADGAHVTVCGRTEEKLKSAVRELSAIPGQGSAAYAVADITVEEQIASAVAAATGPDGHLDIVFANAGGSFHIGPIAEADAEAVRPRSM